jgi:3-isopropylmalate/(R)-2-methylmalate dehydratase large subunit
MRLTGRVLYLTESSDELQRQLDGEDFDGRAVAKHFAVNTDAMISGQACTLGYTPEILGPHFLKNFQETVAEDAVRSGGFQVAVGGDAYGSGSSREVAVVAHQGAGIELVIADSFQRIFQENMVYSGLPFSTDKTVLDRLIAGDDVDLGELADALPPFFRAVAESGGLLPFGEALMNGDLDITYDTAPAARPLNAIEKVIAQRVFRGIGLSDGVASVRPGDQVLCRAGFRGMHEYTAGMVIALYQAAYGDAPIAEPDLVACFEDHFVLLAEPTVPADVKEKRLKPAQRLTEEMVEVCRRYSITLHGPGRDAPAGVCHRIVVEDYALPGTVLCLTDSHSPTAGVLNAFAFGVGSTAMAFALRTGMIPVTVPKVVRVLIHGNAAAPVSPKDLILHLIGDPYFKEEQWRSEPTDTCVIQFGGAGLDNWDVDELSVLTNMTVEGGLMTGMIEPCEPIRAFLRERRSADLDLDALMVYPDEGATYLRSIDLDLAEVPLTVASPGDSRYRKRLDECTSVAIHNVVIASCTGGSFADLKAAAEVLRGQSLAAGVRMTVTPSSAAVERQAEEAGLLDVFRAIGAVLTPSGCGSCIGNGPGIPLPGEVTASTTNRNFDRRMGAPGPVWLVSPAVAAASAITGHLTDPRQII